MKQFDFIIIGASKCGTTSVYDVLSQHPEVAMCPVKEPFIFSFTSWRERLERYGVSKDGMLRGEASPIYAETINNPLIPERIYQHNKDTKIILIVREPFSRLSSVWSQTRSTEHHLRSGYANKTDVDVPLMSSSFSKAVIQYPAYLDACRYKKIYEDYLVYFTEKQIQLCFFDDLAKRPEKFYDEVFEFLNISKNLDPRIKRTVSNKSSGKKEIHYLFFIMRKQIYEFSLSRLIPEFIKKSFRKFMCREIKIPVIEEQLREKIKDELHEDVHFVLDYKFNRQFKWEDWED